MKLAKSINRADVIVVLVGILSFAILIGFVVWAKMRIAEACVESGGTWTEKHECVRAASQ